jgi:acetyl/propionyl-CoA carboxylase alpha subunit
MNIIVSLGVGTLIFIVDKRQNSYFNEKIQIQHKLTREIHEMLTEEIRLINEMKRENNRG